MEFFSKVFDFYSRLGCALWILVTVYVIDPCYCLDSGDSANSLTSASFNGLFRSSIMKSVDKCCVPNCGGKLNDQILHKFPNPDNEPDRFKDWVFKVGGDILGKENSYIFKYRRVCHLHFEEKYHTRSKMLSRIAVPTLHLAGFYSTVRQPLTDRSNQLSSVPSTSGLCSTTSCSLTDPTYQASSQPLTIAPAPSTSVAGCSLKDLPHEASPQPLTSAPAPSTSGTIKKRQIELRLLKTIKELQKGNKSYRQRLQKAKRLSSNSAFQNALNKFKSLAAIFTVMQFREIQKPKMGRRFTREEKMMSLSLYKLGPKAYRWLSKIFILPSPVTISRLISRAGIQPGINKNIFSHLKKRALKMKEDDKLCCLLFDEMAITPHFDFNRKRDKISGFVNYGGVAKRKIADHVLVFMIRGVTRNYKQPIYYSFSAGSTPKDVLATMIKTIVRELHSAGFRVLATVCDQGTSNTSAINYLINETRAEYLRKNETLKHSVFDIDGRCVVPLYDVPHLLKGLRNNLLSKNLKYTMEGKERLAKWEHITLLYENNPCYKGLKVIKNLTENHCNKEKIPKMKVKYASQLFSQTVGKTMGYLADNGILPGETRDTADLMIFIDNLFDSLNGSYQNSKNRSGKDLLRNVTQKSSHKDIWALSKKVLSTMKFVSPTGSAGTVPSINNWIRTIENMELLRDILFKEYRIKSFWCRHFNQDPLENFFGSIRSHGIRNVSPTCAAFEAAFASLLVNTLSSSYSPGSNCEEDSCATLESFEELFFSKTIQSNPSCEIDMEDFLSEDIIINYEDKHRSPVIRAQIEYVSGYLLRKLRPIIKKCRKCKNNFLETNYDKNKYISIREYDKSKRYLSYPTEKLKEHFSNIQDITDYILKKKSNLNNIKTYMKMLLEISLKELTDCDTHKSVIKELIYDFCARFFIYNWCKVMNGLLNGTSRNYHQDDEMQKEAMIYFAKRRKNK